MVNETEHRQVEDPIANYSGLSLFRSTFSPPSLKPYDDLDSIHSILRSMDFGSSAKLVEQGKSVLESNLGVNTENSTKGVGDDAVFAAEEYEEFHRKERGPDLGLNHARPRFSLKETKTPSVEDLLPVLDFKNIKDPNELFIAHERLEKARKEIEKQLGIVPSQSTLDSTRQRERRPGLPGFNRRPIKFRHRFSEEPLDNNADALSSQEAFESDSLDPVGDNTDKGKASLATLDSEVTGSSAVKEKKVNVNDFLKGLLTRDSEELEGIGAMNRLQERLQIKPIVVEKPSVPDFPDSQPMDLKSSHENLSQPSKACYDISNLLKGIDIKTPLGQDVGYPENQLASPTPPRSPVLFSTLQKHISQSNPSGNPFSAHEIDFGSTKESSPTHMVNQEVNIVGSSKLSDEPSAPIIEDVIDTGETNKILDTSAQSKEDNSRKLSEQLNASSMEYEVAVSETCSVDDPIRNCISTPKKSTMDNSSEPGFNANVNSNEPPVNMDLDIGGSGVGERIMDDIGGEQNVEPNEPDQFEDEMLAENMQETSDSIPTDDLNSNLGIPLVDQSNPDAHEDNSTDNRSRRSDDGPEQSLQEKTVGSVASVRGKKRAKMCAQKASKGKRLRLRNSLANVDSNEPPVDMDLDIGGSGVGKGVMDDIAGKQNVEPNEPDQFEDEKLAENMQETSDSIPTDDLNSNFGIPLANQSNPDAHEDNSTDSRSRRSDDGPEQSLQEKTDGSVVSVSGKKSVKMCAQKASMGKRLRSRRSDAHEDNSTDNRSRRSDDGPEQTLQEKTDGSVAPVSGKKRVKMCAQKASMGNRLRSRRLDAHEDNSTDNRSRRLDDGPEQSLQEKTDGSVAPVSGKKSVKMCAQKASKGKGLRPRNSLAFAGTSWESGVRKSSRFRTRPLEFWKGERMVYGRVHESLTTVIGVKCMSPGKDGQPIMKVKSFVSDKHKKLFELASRY